jgi:hypothetical protein
VRSGKVFFLKATSGQITEQKEYALNGKNSMAKIEYYLFLCLSLNHFGSHQIPGVVHSNLNDSQEDLLECHEI